MRENDLNCGVLAKFMISLFPLCLYGAMVDTWCRTESIPAIFLMTGGRLTPLSRPRGWLHGTLLQYRHTLVYALRRVCPFIQKYDPCKTEIRTFAIFSTGLGCGITFKPCVSTSVSAPIGCRDRMALLACLIAGNT